MELLGMPIITMVRGNVVIENGEVVGKSGKSKYIAGNTNTTAYANKQFQVA